MDKEAQKVAQLEGDLRQARQEARRTHFPHAQIVVHPAMQRVPLEEAARLGAPTTGPNYYSNRLKKLHGKRRFVFEGQQQRDLVELRSNYL